MVRADVMSEKQLERDRQTLCYIQDMLGQLKMMAQSSRQELLSYTIGLALYESDRSLKEMARPAGEKTPIDALYLPEKAD